MEEKLKVMAVVFIVFPAAFLLGRSVGCKICEYLAAGRKKSIAMA